MSIPELLGLINRYIKKTISKEEMDILEELLKEEENAELFKDMIKEDYLLKSANREFDSNSALKKALIKINAAPKTSKIFLRQRYKWAAVLIIPIALFFVWKINQSNEMFIPDENVVKVIFDDGRVKVLNTKGTDNLFDSKQQLLGSVANGTINYEDAVASEATNTLKVPYGKHFQIRLSDGTEVFLNAGSSLSYPVSFSGKEIRSVALEGEAFFNVSKDKKRPFIVNTGALAIEVLGTQFNVSAYQENSRIYTTLQEGSVKVNTLKQSFLLQPNDQTVWHKTSATMQKRVVDVSRFTAWMNDEIVFTSSSFNSILRELERQHNVEIINELPEIGNELFTARFSEESVEQIIKYFSESYGFKYTIDENRIIIQK